MHGSAIRVVAFGECMVELSRSVLGGTSWQLGFAGDTYNVAVYLQRLGCRVDYMTALGRDPFSRDMAAEWAKEGVGDALVLHHPDKIPGLYTILVDDQGERSFQYWRGQSAARAFFDCAGAESALMRARGARLLYLSGITLSLFTPGERMKVTALAEAVRAAGGDVAFDSNYRARGWDDVAAAREAIGGFAKYVTIALPTLDDDRDLFGDTSAERCAQRWMDAGVREVAVKLGADGAYVATSEGGTEVAPAQAVTARDTTGAGDSFNAAYLAARFAGQSAEQAAATGNRLAGVVVQQSGAIIRPVLMPVGLIRERSAG